MNPFLKQKLHKDKRHTNKLDFLGYYQIMKQMHKFHEKPNFTITQHNDDKLTYHEAYIIMHHISDLVEENAKAYTSKTTSLLLNIDTLLCQELCKHKVLDPKDVSNIILRAKKQSK